MKNEIETKVTKIIQKAQKNKTFINFSEIYKLHKTHNIKFIIIISTKGLTGKSTSGIKWIIKNLKKDKNYAAVWLRNKEITNKKNKLEDSFILEMLENNFDMSHWIINKEGIFYKEDLEDKSNKGICKVLFAFLNTYDNYSSQNVMKAKDIFFDEFIDAKFVMKNMSLAFNKLIKSLQRTYNAMIVMFANPHTNKNDLLVDSGLIEAIDWESGKTQINFIKNLNTLFCYISDYQNKYFTKADNELNKFFQYNEEVQMFNKGILLNPIKNIIPWNKLDTKNFIPICKFHVRDNQDDTDFVIGKIKDLIIMKQLSIKEYKQLKIYAVRACDLIPNGIYITEIDNSIVPLLINKYKTNKLIFTNLFTEDIFKRIILPKLSNLEMINKKYYV